LARAALLYQRQCLQNVSTDCKANRQPKPTYHTKLLGAKMKHEFSARYTIETREPEKFHRSYEHLESHVSMMSPSTGGRE